MSNLNSDNFFIISTRSASMGGFLIFQEDQKNYNLNAPIVKECLASLKQPHQDTITAVLKVALDYIDDEFCIGYKELHEVTGIPLQRLKTHVRELRELGVIKQVRFKFLDGTFHPKVIAERFVFTPIKMEVKKNKAGAELVNKRWRKEKELQTYDVKPMDKRVDPKNLPHVVRPRGEFIVDQLVSPTSRPRGLIARRKSEVEQRYDEQSRAFTVNTRLGPKSFLAQIRSFTNVMDASDLQVQYAVYSLIFNYHSYYSQNSEVKPKNLTPVYVDDIVLMLGRTLGGKNRSYVRDCIQIIEDTEFNLLSLESMKISLNETQLEGFVREKYKNFKSCTPITQTPPSIDPTTNRVVFAQDAMVYLIALPDQIFENLIQDETVFAFPPESLSMPALIFALYLRFRALVRDFRFSESLENLREKLQYAPKNNCDRDSIFTIFKHALKNELNQISKHPQEHLYAIFEGERVTFNMFGYHGEIDFENDKYFVVCDNVEMLNCCRVSFNPKSIAIKESAPVVYNGMSALYPERLHKRLNIAINKLISSEVYMFNMRYTSEKSEEEVLVHKYASSTDIRKAAQTLSKMVMTKFDIFVLEEKIERDLDALVGLKVVNYTLTKSDIEKIMHHEVIQPYLDILDVIDLLQRINRTRSVHMELLEYLNQEVTSPKLMRFLDRYIQTKFPEEEY